MTEPYGARTPGRLDRAIIAATSRLPDNWLGLRLAIGRTRPMSPLCRLKYRPLLEVLIQESITRIDALKIDVEGAEERILIPFFNEAEKSLWPKLLIIEDARTSWRNGLFSYAFQVRLCSCGADEIERDDAAPGEVTHCRAHFAIWSNFSTAFPTSNFSRAGLCWLCRSRVRWFMCGVQSPRGCRRAISRPRSKQE